MLGTIIVETIVVVIAVFAAVRFYSQGFDPATMVLAAARYMVPPVVGVLLLGAACVVVLSTAMNYLLSPTTNIMRDIYQSFINPKASEKTMVTLQKVMVVLLGIVALFVGIRLTSVLGMAYFAYTIYGVAITPALLAALTWKRATKAGGLASIILGTLACLGAEAVQRLRPRASQSGGRPVRHSADLPVLHRLGAGAGDRELPDAAADPGDAGQGLQPEAGRKQGPDPWPTSGPSSAT